MIDDEAPIRLLCRVNLEAEGMSVLEAGDGPSGLEARAAGSPDVILLDVMMPGLDGWGVAEALLEDDATASIPIIFLTARAEFRDRARGLDIGGVDYITKPFNPVELAPLVRGLLDRLERGERDELRREKLSELRAPDGRDLAAVLRGRAKSAVTTVAPRVAAGRCRVRAPIPTALQPGPEQVRAVAGARHPHADDVRARGAVGRCPRRGSRRTRAAGAVAREPRAERAVREDVLRISVAEWARAARRELASTWSGRRLWAARTSLTAPSSERSFWLSVAAPGAVDASARATKSTHKRRANMLRNLHLRRARLTERAGQKHHPFGGQVSPRAS